MMEVHSMKTTNPSNSKNDQDQYANRNANTCSVVTEINIPVNGSLHSFLLIVFRVLIRENIESKMSYSFSQLPKLDNFDEIFQSKACLG